MRLEYVDMGNLMSGFRSSKTVSLVLRLKRRKAQIDRKHRHPGLNQLFPSLIRLVGRRLDDIRDHDVIVHESSKSGELFLNSIILLISLVINLNKLDDLPELAKVVVAGHSSSRINKKVLP